MSLETRLRIWIAVLVVGVVISLSAVTLHSVVETRFEDLNDRAQAMAAQIQSVLVQRLREQMPQYSPTSTLEETKAVWTAIVLQDQALSVTLKDTLANSKTVIEIQIVGESGTVLSSSDPDSVGTKAQALPKLADWAAQSRWKQLLEVFRDRGNYEVAIPLGVGEQTAPVFQVKVIISSILLRNTLMPQNGRGPIQELGFVLLVSFLAAIVLAAVGSKVALRPLARVSAAIDRIARGESPGDLRLESRASKEMEAIESKLQVLGQQFRGAREDATEMRTNIEQLLERMEEAVLLFDRNDRLIMAGRAAEGILGRGRWELMGKTIEELFPPTTLLGASVRGAIEFRKSLKNSPITIQADGKGPVQLLMDVELLETFPSRDRLGTLVTLRDAETRREIGTQLDVSARLAAISRLTGGVAHEIKNPLNSIALHLEVLRARLEDQGPHVQREIDVISNEITRLDRVVKTFLDFTKPVDPNLLELDVARLAREIGTLVEPEARKRKIAVEVDAEAGGVLVQADQDLLKQAILNVVMNGIEAMDGGGRLRIEVRRSGEDCVIGISDHGAGIPPEVRDKIFNLYFTTKGAGSGIGLAVTFRVLQLHNGTINFTTETGKGTTFWLRLPVLENKTTDET